MKSDSVEIELKAHVDNKDAVLEMLHKRYSFKGEYFKKDRYFSFDSSTGKRNVRIRTVDGDSVITFKEKTKQNGIEVNDEWEIKIDNAGKAEALLEYLGCSFNYAKTKQGYLFRDGELTIELSLVSKLGWFLELEYLAGDNSPESVTRGETLIRKVLTELHIPEASIEPRYYADLIHRASQ